MIQTVLLIEDTPSLSRIYKDFLQQSGFSVCLCENGRDALSRFKSETFDAVLLDLKLPDMDGMTILKEFKRQRPSCPVIMITAHGSLDNALDAMKLGAQDFLVKPFTMERLRVTLRNVLESAKLKEIVATYEGTGRKNFHGFVGSSLQMQSIYRIIENAAKSKATVFITGESGTGKEVCARAIHDASDRRDKNFVALNCGAIPKDLMESEIFGHIKGSFTGAVQNRDGAAATAEGGTLFLDEIGEDEIGEMDMNLQTKLLRFLQTSTYTPVGSNEEKQADIRIVCATNKDPLTLIKEGRFREDLYYRLYVIPIHLPPLRERSRDILEIAEYILQKTVEEESKDFQSFGQDVLNAFLHYPWSGNIREMQNVIRHAVVLNQGRTISMDMLPLAFQEEINRIESNDGLRSSETELLMATYNNHKNEAKGVETMNRNEQTIKPLWLVEKETIERAIELCDGNIPRAAMLLEISPSTIYRKKAGWPDEVASNSNKKLR